MPIEIFNDTPLRLGFMDSRRNKSDHVLTVIAKGCYALSHAAAVEALPDDERAWLSGAVYAEPAEPMAPGEPPLPLLYPSDFAPHKPQTDVLLLGTCYAPGGKPASAVRVSLRVGDISKSLTVFGNRRWKRSAVQQLQMTEPEPFVSLPLGYAHSYGAADYPANPLGRGHVEPDMAPHTQRNLPNIELHDRLIKNPEDTPQPAGLGPIDSGWPQRQGKAGTYDDSWLAERWPWYPVDFDWSYFNAAPADQCFDYLRGDERLALLNLHPEHARYQVHLPGVRTRCLLRCAGGEPGAGSTIREVVMQLDTLWLDMDEQRLVLVWRGVTSVASRDHAEVEQALLVQEPLSRAPLAEAHYHAERFWQHPQSEDGANAKDAAKDKDGSAGGAADATAPPDEEAIVAQALAEVREMLTKARVPTAIVADLDGASSVQELMTKLVDRLDTDPAAAERVQKNAQEQARTLLTEQGYDPDLIEALNDDEEKALGRLTRQEVERYASLGRSLAGADVSELDLSGLALDGVDMHGANLAGCLLHGTSLKAANLVNANLNRVQAALEPAGDGATPLCLSGARLDGATLDEAQLDGAQLDGAILANASLKKTSLLRASLVGAELREAAMHDALLSHADLSQVRAADARLVGAQLDGARLDKADLTGASLHAANLAGASLQSSELDGVDLSSADLRRAHGEKARLRGADLSNADLRDSFFDNASFEACKLDGAQLQGASLCEVWLEKAHGDNVTMEGADVRRLRAGSGCVFPRANLRDMQADGSIWSGADLSQADFGGSALERADFSGAQLTKARFHRAALKYANFTDAVLREALLTKVNLFQGRLERADLTAADCSGSNCFECEFWDAITDKMKRTGTNLSRTKLDLSRTKFDLNRTKLDLNRTKLDLNRTKFDG